MRHVESGFGSLTETVGYYLLKTPTSQLAVNGGSQHPDKRKAGGHGPTLADEVEHLLSTPIVSDGTGGPKNLNGALFAPQLREIKQLLPTPIGDNTHPQSDVGKQPPAA
jgi:hypothetical protein